MHILKRLCITAAWLIATSLMVSAQSSAGQAATSGAEGDIKALESKLADLIIHDGWDEYASHLAADYQRTDESGVVQNKTEALASLGDAKRKIIVMEMEPASATVRIYGETAIANEEFTVSARASGQVKTHRIRQTHVFIRRDGQWVLVNEQATTIGK